MARWTFALALLMLAVTTSATTLSASVQPNYAASIDGRTSSTSSEEYPDTEGFWLQILSSSGQVAIPFLSHDFTTLSGYSSSSTCVYTASLRTYSNNDCCFYAGVIVSDNGCCSELSHHDYPSYSGWESLTPVCLSPYNSNPSSVSTMTFHRISTAWTSASNSFTWNNYGKCSLNSGNGVCYSDYDVFTTSNGFAVDTSSSSSIPNGFNCASHGNTVNNAYRITVNAALANNAIRGSTSTGGQVSYYITATTSSSSNLYYAWFLSNAPDGASTDLDITYANCANGATCTPNGVQASCVCPTYYTGDGTTQGTGCIAPANCAAASVNGYSFGVTAPGATATVSCASGYSGSVTVQCSPYGTSFLTTTFVSTCTQLTCPVDNSGSYGNAYWPSSVSSSTPVSATGCIAGYNSNSGTPTRLCQSNGGTVSWSSSVTNPCVSNTCSAQTYQGYSFATTAGGATASAPCACGYSGSVTLACNLGGVWATTVNTAGCSLLYCPAQTGSSTTGAPSFASVLACSSGTGTCPPNWSGTPSQSCLQSGSWSGTIVNPCSIATCAAITGSSSTGAPSYPITNAGVTASGICPVGWYGTASSTCNQVSTSVNGAWTLNSNNCQPATCAGYINSTSHTNWTTTNSLSTASGTCIDGYTGSPSRLCGAPATQGQSNGVWSSQINNPCSLVYVAPTCPVLNNDNNANWPGSNANTTVTGLCVTGYTGTPTRTCSATGVWQALITQCTQVTCASVTTTDGGTTFPVTASGSSATGVCSSGWQYNFTAGVAPSLSCPLSSPTSSFNLNNVVNPCVQTQCPSITVNASTFPTAYSNTNAAGVCALGYSGSPTRRCNADGTWGTINNPCIQLFCPTQYDYDATWPSTVAAGASYTATCNLGYAGSPQRTCNYNGTWATTVSNPCEQLSCPNITESNAFFPSSLALNENVTGTCPETYSGLVYRICDYNGNWQTIQGVCSLNFCPAGTFGNAIWTSTLAGTFASGVCISGFLGSPNMSCLNNGSWSENFINPCQPIVYPCALSSFGNANWPVTQPGQIANGTCDAGFGGSPTRLCQLIGQWTSDISNPCVFLTLPTFGRIENLVISSVTASSVSLTWECNDANVTQYLVQISADAVNFQALLQPSSITTKYATATGLTQASTYYFLVYAGNGKAYDTQAAQITAFTAINPPGDVAISDLSSFGVDVSWGPGTDSLAQWYLVSYYISTSTRDATETNFTQVANITAEADGGNYNLTGLAPSTAYVILVQAGCNGTAEPTGSQVSVTTLAQSSLSTSSNTTTVAVGAALGALGFLLLLLLIAFLLYRKRVAQKQRDIFKEYGSNVELIQNATLNRSGQIPNSILIDNRSVGDLSTVQMRTQIIGGADQTLLNTVMEVALPGFLKLDYATDIRMESKLTSGGAGTIFRATLLDNQLAVRHGLRQVCVKQVADWPGLSAEESTERFHQEVSIMWSLSFHPNIIKLIGFCDSPRSIVTRLYPTDLFRFLHNQEDKSQLNSSLILHFSVGLMSGLSAIHSMGIAHRDIKSPNVLLAEPTSGLYPDPVICDFGLSRTGDDSSIKKSSVINGFSPRYAPPEVMARIHLKNAVNTVDDDKSSDIYSMGVVYWEIFSREIPWKDLSNEEIELNIRSGGRVPPLQPNEKDDVHVIVVAIVDNCLQQSPERRPTASAINSKLKDVVTSRGAF